ncbi:unnamed protein product [Nippostrongylus brasiliensis]|uniref:Probable 26S proteasome regulatory subunit rpn-6.2 (inferred by orthology to a C. elegans protein) n=1 Tax=Nippostrongylus brasiliensis TaxID=27835 RepID=A0A0N4XXN6_NIPBR|nr:unnamed protein product [Nippostrongylus brasiliensis]
MEYCLQVNQDNNEKARLIRLYNDIGRYTEAQRIAGPLVSELKKIEDRELIMEVTLEESRSAFALKNFSKAALDLQSGILYSADEKDFKTAFSYCYEALEGFLIADPPKAVRALKYMCLCKIMLNEADAIPLMLSTKEITRVIEPYSEIDLSHIVRCVGMTQKQIEKQLSLMLLDKKIFGVIDQHNGTVRVYQKPEKDKTYQTSVELIRALSKTVDAIYGRAGKLLK